MTRLGQPRGSVARRHTGPGGHARRPRCRCSIPAPSGGLRPPAGRCATRSSSRGTPSASATAATGSRSTTTCRHRQLVAGRADRAPGERHRDDPRGLRRGDAAEPSAARRRRTVRHARGLSPRADRPGYRAGAGHRSADRSALRRSPAPAAPDLPAHLGQLLGYFEGAVPPITAVPDRGARYRALAARLERLQRPGRGHLGLPFAFAHHFAPDNTMPALAVYPRQLRALAEARPPPTP